MSDAQIYVGTYAKYNNGSLAGKWLIADDYSDHAEFIDACLELHSDESDPELMFQDYQGFPAAFYAESSISPQLWDWLQLSDDDREVVALYRDHIDSDESFETALERYQGCFESPADWAEQFADDTGILQAVPENLRYYFDFAAWARDCQLNGDVTFVDDHGSVRVFDNH